MKKSLCITSVVLILLASGNIAAQWKLAASNVITPIFRPYNGGGVIINHNGTLWAGYKDVWMSADTGKSWSLRTPFNTFNNSCIKDISFFDDNIGLATTQNGEVYITQDRGLSWIRHVPPNPLLPSIESGCFAGSSVHVIACTYTGDLYVSNDGGMTWSMNPIDSAAYQLQAGSGGNAYLISGTTAGSKLWETHTFGGIWVTLLGQFNPDSYSFVRDRCDTSLFYVANDNLASKAENSSRVFISPDVGQSWQANDLHLKPYLCGSITASSDAIFVQTFYGVRRSTDQGQTWNDIGGPPNITDTRFVTAIDNNVVVAVDSFGSVWVTTNSGGDSLSIIDGSKLSLQTADQKTDTIGGTVAVPISINGLTTTQDFDLTIHYDPLLSYQGTYSGNMKLDIAGESWSGRSRIHIQGANSSGVLANAYFIVFSDSSGKPIVTIDSLKILTAIVPCNNILNISASSTLTPVSGCGADILTQFIRDSLMQQLRIVPNPSNGDFSIISSAVLGEVNVTIYDMLGRKQEESIVSLAKDMQTKLSFPLPNGVFLLRVRSATKLYELSIVVNR